jgi:hypothetical protein
MLITELSLGGFLAGLIIPHENGFAISLVEKLEDLVSILFLPIVGGVYIYNSVVTNSICISTSLSLDYEPISDCLITEKPGATRSSFVLLRLPPNSFPAPRPPKQPASTGANHRP